MKTMIAAALLALVACDGPKVDADGDGRVSIAELCAGFCACEDAACYDVCLMSGGGGFVCREALAQCLLDAADEGECQPCGDACGDIEDPTYRNSTRFACEQEACQ